ncbi:MAG: hypothetical protein ABT20_03105 [Rubrivivax sp. SCN 70-15]|nr:MAG: hypothetical protein ABT20_03105 [Rubrivivax sp. SCN 70-15]
MDKNHRSLRASAIALALSAGLAPTAWSADDVGALREQVDALRQEVQALKAALDEQRRQPGTADRPAPQTQATAPSSANQAGLPSDTDMQPRAAAHLAGYGAVGYASAKGGDSSFNMVQLAPIFHFAYGDRLFFETELNITSNDAGGTNVDLEYANLNYFLNDHVALFAGKFLTPVGYFFQNLHPAWINKFASRPPGFGGEGSAAPESDIGVGARGGFALGDTARANYAVYVGNGPRLALNAAGDEIEAIEGEAATSNPSRHKLLAGRFAVLPIPGLELGVSLGASRLAVQRDDGTVEARRSYQVAGADFAFRRKALELRGEYIQQRVGDLASSVAPEGGTWKAGYVQAAYRITPQWEPVVRFGDFRSPHPDQRKRQWAAGVNYYVAPSAVAKLGFESNRGEAGTPNDSDRVLVQFAYGF